MCVPLPTCRRRLHILEATSEWTVSADDVASVGTLFMQSLLTLKHLGALAQTADALQIVCETVLSHGARHVELAALPHVWMEGLLSKLDNAFSQGLVSGLQALSLWFASEIPDRRTCSLIC